MQDTDSNCLEEEIRRLEKQLEEDSNQLAVEQKAGVQLLQDLHTLRTQLDLQHEQIEKIDEKIEKEQERIAKKLESQSYFQQLKKSVHLHNSKHNIKKTNVQLLLIMKSN